MGIAKAVILTYNTSGNITNRKAYNQIIKADISKDGERVVDSATMELPGNTSTSTTSTLSVGNGVYYIQDVADTTFLSGIWNMHYNILDESGNDLDATSTNEAVTKYAADTGTQFNGHIARTFAATGDELVIADPASRSDNLTGALLSFAAGFDFYVWIQCSDTSAAPKYIFDREDTVGGLALYITGGATGTIKLDKWVTSTQTNIITGAVQVNDGNWHLIRVNRDSTNTFNLYVDNTADGTPVTDSTSYQNNTPSFIIGNNSASAGTRRPFIGNMFQARFYTGGTLTSVDATTVYNYKPQPYTMKFGGTIWQVTNNTDSKTIQANGFSQILANVNIRPTGSSDSPANYNNVYQNQTPKFILTDPTSGIISNWFPGWTVIWIPSAGSSITYFTATGNLLQNMLALLYTVGDNLTFWTNARKVLYVEALGFDRTDAGAFDKGSVVFIGTQKGGRYDITQNGSDASVFVNDLTFIGNNDLSSKTDFAVIFSAGVQNITATFYPQNVTAYVNGVLVPVSTVNPQSKVVQLANTYSAGNGFGAPTVTTVGTTGSRRRTYRINYNVGTNPGTPEVSSATAFTITSNNTLSTSNYNTISGWVPSPGTYSYDVLVDDDAALSVSTVGTPGTTHDTYQIIPLDGSGNQMGGSQTFTITTANATLNGTNYNTLTWSAVRGASTYDVLANRGSDTMPSSGSIRLTNTNLLTVNDQGAALTSYTTRQVKSALLASSPVLATALLSINDNTNTLSSVTNIFANNPLVVLQYQYEGIIEGSTSNPYAKIQDANSIKLFGDYSKIITMPGYRDATQGVNFAKHYFTRYSNFIGGSVTGSGTTFNTTNTSPALPQRITINAGTLVNCIRENMKVGVVAGLQGQTYSATFGTASNTSYSPIAQIIKSMTFSFPSGQTVIHVGDFMYDMYDPSTAQASGINQATQQYTTVKNV